MSSPRSESQLQAAAHQWLWNTRPDLRGLFWMIHNDGRKSLATAVADKARGLVAGVPDWCLMVQRLDFWQVLVPGLFVEFKFGAGRLSPDQARIHSALSAQGYEVQVIRTLEEFQQAITAYLAD